MSFPKRPDPNVRSVGADQSAAAGGHTELDAVAHVVATEDLEPHLATAGRYDLMFEVIVESERHLLDLLSDLRERRDVVEVEAFPVLGLYKQTFAWGT